MSVSIYWTGKTTPEYLRAGVIEYMKRIKRFDKLEIKEFKETKGLLSAQQTIILEEKELNNHLLKTSNHVILLDEKGTTYSSKEFAKWLENKINLSNNKLCFIIGGAYGFSDEFKNNSKGLLSVSKMTMSHQLVRLVFMEQLYRAYTILNNLPYHNE